MNLAQLLARSARVFPDAPALYHGTSLVADYSGLAARAARVAGYLRDHVGLEPGDRCAVLMANQPEYLEALYGIWWAGLVAVPINAKLHAREAQFIIEDAGAAALFLSASLGSELLALLGRAP
jgi:long-chain acyl-CoA synthetase